MAGKKRINIDFDQIIHSNSCGPYKIIENMGWDERSRLWVKVKFLNTGTEKVTRYDIAMAGKVRDDLFGIDFNTVYNSLYYGQYKIISYLGRNDDSKKMVRIRFLNTGYEYDTYLKFARIGQVKDYSVNYYDRSIQVPPHTPEYDKFIESILRGRWKGMMDRCYNPNDGSYYKYGAVGIRVCDFWHNVDNYLASVPKLKGYDQFYLNPQNYQIDKDYLQQGIPTQNKIYSPETCIFLSSIDNSNLSMYKDPESGYYGIKKSGKDRYTVEFSIEGKKVNFGTYSNLTAALNEYNFYYLLFGRFTLVPLLNTGFEPMTHAEAQKYLIESTSTE